MARRTELQAVRRQSLPLTASDIRDLEMLRQPSPYRDALVRRSSMSAGPEEVTESVLLHALLEAGLAAIREDAENEGYAVLAAQRSQDADARREQARRRRPSWADEA